MVSRGDTRKVRMNPVGLRAPLSTPTRYPPKLWDSQFTGPSDLSLGPPCDAFPPSRVQAHLAEGDVRLRMSPRAPFQCWGEPVTKEQMLRDGKSRPELTPLPLPRTYHSLERELWVTT